MKPVVVYLFLALVINILIDVSWRLKEYMPPWLKSNNFLYNIHSVVRFIAFILFFLALQQPFLQRVKKIVPIIALVAFLVNFIFFEDFFAFWTFSSFLLAAESGILLFYCLQYYLFKLQEDAATIRGADFWFVTGLSIYVVFNFFFFLFYTSLTANNYKDFTEQMWHFHNVSFIVLCLFIAKAFYASRHQLN